MTDQSETLSRSQVQLVTLLLEVHYCVAPFISQGKLHEFGERKPISSAKPAHFDIFTINFTVWSHIRSTGGDWPWTTLRSSCHKKFCAFATIKGSSGSSIVCL
jgi:hypothetical protein